jgi:large subunit ribosomal protein L33
MAKAAKETVFLVSESGSGFFYTIRKNKKKKGSVKKLSLKKYDPVARAHVTFGEKKLAQLKRKFNLEEFNEKKSASNVEEGLQN